MGDTLAGVQFVKTLLDGREKIHAVGNLRNRGVIGQFGYGVEHKFFLRHKGNILLGAPPGKLTSNPAA